MKPRNPLPPAEARARGQYPLAPSRPRPELPPEGSGTESPYAERLHKLLAHAAIASRRACEALIREGRVKVDGRVVREMGVRVDPRRQEIRFDDTPVRFEKRVAFALHKPKDVLCTNADELGRMRVIDLMKIVSLRIYPVGRLDKDSEGLIIVTNDGQLALRLTHPRYGVEKVYEVWVSGLVTDEALKRLRKGVWLAEGRTRLEEVRIVARHREETHLRVAVAEGRNREIRRVMAKVGHQVKRLLRTTVGPVTLGSLEPGRYRPLTEEEWAALLRPKIEGPA